MVSNALKHFPPVVFQNGERVLWNLIQRKPFANRPEERVRLRYLDFLLQELHWPKTRIAIESTLSSPTSSDKSLRADLVCYTRQMEPAILIECKSESVRLDASAALQIARYNRSVQAPWLCITNGLRDFWYEIVGGKPVGRTGPPEFLQDGGAVRPLGKSKTESSQTISGKTKGKDDSTSVTSGDSGRKRMPEYWIRRGFLGRETPSSLLNSLAAMSDRFWKEAKQPSSVYLTFQIGFKDIPLDHYYRLFDVPDNGRLAVTFTGSAAGKSCLVAFLNVKRANRGFLVVDLEKLLTGEENNTELVLKDRVKILDIRNNMDPEKATEEERFVDNLPAKLYDIFRNHM